MKKLIMLWLLGTLVIFSCTDPKKSKETNQPVVAEITEEEALGLLHDWTDAYLSDNAAPLNTLLDDTWLYSGSANGKTSNKVATIEEFSNADYKFAAIDFEDLAVTIYDDIAIVRGAEKMLITANLGKDTTIVRLRFTDVYQKKDGEIKAISTHSSPIVED